MRPALEVLLAEDEAVIAMSLEQDLQSAGYLVEGPYSSCAVALSALAKVHPTAAIIDAVLQDGLCRELAAELRRRAIPFIYSGKYKDQVTPEFEDAPWIEKRVQSGTLLAAVDCLTGAAQS